MNITAKELSGVHIGKAITVILDGLHLETERHTGILYAVSHGSRLVSVTLGIARIEGIPHDTPITIQEGQ